MSCDQNLPPFVNAKCRDIQPDIPPDHVQLFTGHIVPAKHAEQMKIMIMAELTRREINRSVSLSNRIWNKNNLKPKQ